jgi:predicted dehydrogenase
MDRLRLIQCGVGGFGRHWVTDVSSKSEDFELVAIVDISEKALHEAGDAIGLPAERRFTNLESAIDAIDPRAVLTVTPPAVHIEHARIAFARGLHLMSEKPIADTMNHATEMVQLARQAQRQLLISQNFRFSAAAVTLRRLIREQAAGELGHGHIDFYLPADFGNSFRATMPHVLLMDMAIHHLDMIRAITGRNITRVFAQTFRPTWSWYQTRPGLKMVMELEGGIPFSYSGDWSARGRNTGWNGNWRLQCADGSLHLEHGDPERLLVARSSKGFSDDAAEETIPLDQPELTGQAATLHAFAEAIRMSTPAQISGEDNLWSFGAVMAGVRSAEEGRPVSVNDVVTGQGRN